MKTKKNAESAESPAPTPPQKERRWLRYDFTHDELFRMGKDLARETEKAEELTKAKEEVVSDFKARITAAEAQASRLSLCVNKGYEMRDIECLVTFHSPENGKKTFTRTDTGEIVATEFMDAAEMQEQLPLEKEAAS